MTFRSAFEGEFTAGHNVVDPHVHTFRVQVTCVGVPGEAGACEGMVVDFGLLSTAFKSQVRDELEGYMLIGPNDQLDPASSLLPVRRFPLRPTVENLARWCFEQIERQLGETGSLVERVAVWENDACMASYTRCS